MYKRRSNLAAAGEDKYHFILLLDKMNAFRRKIKCLLTKSEKIAKGKKV